jgi:hypothetical protein
MRQRFHHAIIIVISWRIKPNAGLKPCCGLDLPQPHHQVTGSPHDDTVSFHFGKLALKFLTVRASDKKSAMFEPSRDYAREIGVRGMGRG